MNDQNTSDSKVPAVEEIARKITAKLMVGKNITVHVLEGKDSRELYTIVGVASGTKVGDSEYGQWTALKGDFEAVSLVTGEVVRSGTCFLPSSVQDPIVAQVGLGKSVEFAFIIGIAKDETVAVGFRYTAKVVRNPAAQDPIAQMRQMMLAAAPKVQPLLAKNETRGKK